MIETLLSQLWIQQLGWTLLHFLWQGTAIAAIYAVLRGIFGRSLSSDGRYRLACLALTAMAIAPPVTFLLLSHEGSAHAGNLPAIPWNLSLSEWQRTLPVFVIAWLAGVLAFSIRLYGGWRFTARLRATSHPAPPEWQRTLEDLTLQMTASLSRTGRPVRLWVSSLVDVPTVIGWLRPMILMPVGALTGLPPEHVAALLAHELAHIRRHDYVASVLQSLAEAVLFYHPAVWWISQQIRAERELCCDDLAVAASGDALTYARALAQLESIQPRRLTTALAANDGSLVSRIRRLIEPSQPVADTLPGAGAAWSMTLLWIAGVGVATVHAAQTPTPMPRSLTLNPVPAAISETRGPSPFAEPAPGRLASHARDAVLFDPFLSAQVTQPVGPSVDNLPPAFRAWVNDDVSYIISAEERNAFLQLDADDARQQFIEQFWQRRDPTPGTLENEYKEEHYRRIEYANTHFGSAVPGWKTDRGRIYITLGPPDEIESHASGVKPFPFEVWRYHYIDGLGNNVPIEFDDIANTGELRIAQSLPDTNPGMSGFDRMAQFFRTQAYQPKAQYPFAPSGALAISGSLPMPVQFDYLRGTDSSVLVNITVRFDARDLQFQPRDGGDRAVVNVFGQITSLTGRPITRFEPTLEIVLPPGAAHDQPTHVYQQSVPLAPGRYRVLVMAKDIASGKLGTWETPIEVPHFDEARLATSSLILADVIEKLPAKAPGVAMFAIGDSKIRPRVGAQFTTNEKLGVYLQVYNFTPAADTQKPAGSVEYEIDKAGSFVKAIDVSEEVASIPNASASQVTIQKLLPLTAFAPGAYVLKVTVTDRNGNQTLQRQTIFTVVAIE